MPDTGETIVQLSGGRMRVFDFDRAIVREPGRSVVAGIRSDLRAEPDFEGVAKEHRAYVAALRAAGLDVEVLPPLERYPDSVFVEDPALVLPEGAVLLRPGAATRLGERDGMRDVLRRHFERVLELDDGEFADGGDVLVTPETIFIGLSGRTNRAGANALRAKLGALGRQARIAETPPSILHFKTACSLLSEDTILATKAMADSGIFAGFDIVLVPEGEEAAANLLRVNDAVFVGACFPRTIELIAKAGFDVVPLPVTEIGKLDAGLSCMSLRWRTAPAA
jgi:dimethylargininase